MLNSINRISNRSFARYFSSKPQVGFIGLGNMGGHMARNVMKAGYPLVVFDVNTKSAEALKEAGAKQVFCPKDVAAACDTIITMLPSTPHVKEVYQGISGIMQSARPGSLFIDSSTIEPGAAADVANEVTEQGMMMVDAPVSGGIVGAEAGTLTFMVGGSEEGFSRAKPLLETMGANIVHCGKEGSGQVAKVCNNLVLGSHMIAISEAMNLGVKLGMDPKTLAGVFNTSSARCWSSDTYNPCPGALDKVLPCNNEYEGGFATKLMLKDLSLALEAANKVGAELPAGTLSQHLYQMLADPEQGGLGDKDFGIIYEFLKNAPPRPAPGQIDP